MPHTLRVLLVSCALFASASAHAVPITFHFSGSVTIVDTPIADVFATGQPVTGSYTFESSTTGLPWYPLGILDPSVTYYPNALTAFDVTIGTYTVGLGQGEQRIFVINNDAHGLDRYLVEMYRPAGAVVHGMSPNDFFLSFEDPTGTALSSGDLPLVPIDPTKFSKGGALDFVTGIDPHNRVQFAITSLVLPCVEVAFEFMPQTLNLKSNGKWVTGYLRPPAPYLASQIDVSSLRLNGAVPASTEFRPVIENGDTQLTVKFARAEVEPTLTPGTQVPVAVTGTIAGRPFTGADTIKVIAPKTRGLLATPTVAPASIVNLTWNTTEETSAGPVALLCSLDGGFTWTVQTGGLPAAGSYAWTAPDVAAEQAQLVVGVIHGTDGTGPVLSAEVEVSDPFSIMAATGVETEQPAFALRPQNPAVGPVAIRFSLPSGAPAQLTVHDVSGRCVAQREVGSDGPGWHTTRLGDVPTGLYFVRLTQAGHSLLSRLAIVR